ncbi:MAG: LpxL/LpxP family Kdo(2)-lipid IV(A) lauroyl/palmitoleoyl acyltransferase [Candidatus Anaerobiospirillum merdipullorum]|uniref:Lipid A biosynthesis acyltransferase n=1 Tax=Candidatus Anaerobiospirillum merdipullorum TaxID=2838450 RepID=A0A9E2KP29_9GAMM|nr:LpxL/LpxP family Kdo(2)-lipid IV(A) lauroyl/palmitoleoyl acyltransferase [Candidatus Anaerobiospirillum merdipullorum]
MKKIKLHTSFEKRKEQHRDIVKERGWGKGVTTGVKFTARLLYPNFWGSWLTIALLYLLVTLLPYPLIMATGRVLGHLTARILPGRRYVTERNLELAFPQMPASERKQLAQEIYANAGMGMLETGMAWFWSDKRLLKHAHIDAHELKAAQELAAQNKPILVLTCHFVTLELMARLYALLIKPGVGVYRSSDHPVWEFMQVNGRLRSNLALVDRTDPRSIIKALLKGYPIWYAPDQDYGRRVSIFVPFFGVDKAATVTGTHDLAKVRGCSVQPSWTIREAGGYRLYVKAPLDNFPTTDVEADTRRCNAIIEEMIQHAPAQYLWLHRRFKTAPEGESPRYPEVG